VIVERTVIGNRQPPVDKTYLEATEMSVSPAGLTNTAKSLAVAVPQPPSPAPSVGAESSESTEVLITTQQVLFGTAAARGVHRNQTGGRFSDLLRRFFGTSMDETRPRRHDEPRRYGFREDAVMARAMFRL
jgi:hypothetical protein